MAKTHQTQTNTFWSNQRVLVTGAHGFLGKHLVEQLKSRGVEESKLFTPKSKDLDLRDLDAVEIHLRVYKPTIIIHCAARVGGIGANRVSPGTFFYDNLIMGVQLMETVRVHFPKAKFVTLGTVCSYPRVVAVPFSEESLWSGYPEETNAPYGIAKKSLLVMGQAYRQQYGLNVIHLLPTNLFGPGDNFDEDTSHVIPALIKRLVHARDTGQKMIRVWGSGTATRDFLYVSEAARGILDAAESYDEPEPMNLGSGVEVSIKTLVDKLNEIIGYKGDIIWDTSKPDGQPRRCLNSTLAERKIGWNPRVPLMHGLIETVRWYESEHYRKPVRQIPLWQGEADPDEPEVEADGYLKDEL